MNKIGGVIVSHGQVAGELLAAAETIVGAQSHITAVSIGWHDDVELAKDEISRAIKKVSDGKGVLLLTDMFGGTPTNLVLPFAGEEVEVVTGVNLPMLIKACQIRTKPLAEVARIVCAQGRESVQVAGDLLQPGGRHGTQ